MYSCKVTTITSWVVVGVGMSHSVVGRDVVCNCVVVFVGKTGSRDESNIFQTL